MSTSSTSPPPPLPKPTSTPLPLPRLLLTTVAMAGIQICYAAQINLGTPHLLHLDLPPTLVSLAWLAGPLSGLLVQPIVGLASDACTSPLGRRRPFLIVGALLTALALVLFASAHRLAHALFSAARARPVALAVAVCTFFLLDFAIQAIQAPLRALVTDVLPRAQLARGNACIGFYTGLGNLAGGVLAGVRLSHVLPLFPTDVDAVFWCAAAILLITVAACVVSTREVPLSRGKRPPSLASSFIPPAEHGAKGRTPRERVRDALLDIPRPFWQVFVVQLCTWCGFFTLFVYVNTWVGTNVFLGNPKGDAAERVRYDEGVRFGGRGNALTAMVTVAYSALLPKLLDRFGVVPVYAFSQIVEAICLLSAPFIRGTPGQVAPSLLLKGATLLDIGCFGIVWATTMGVPWTLIGNALDSDPRYAQRLGFFTTLFNASQSFPQLIVAFIAPLVLSIINDSSAVMFLGGLCAAAGAVLVIVLRVPISGKKRKEDGSGLQDLETPRSSRRGSNRVASVETSSSSRRGSIRDASV